MLSAMKDKTFNFNIFISRLSNNSSKAEDQGSRNDFIVNIEHKLVIMVLLTNQR